MAQSVVDKRRNIAAKTVDAATQLWDALQTLLELQSEHTQIADFAQSDFDGTDLQHLNPTIVGGILGNIAPDLQTFLTVTHPTYDDYLLQARR